MLLSFWSAISRIDFVENHPGIVLVVIGVAGEVICDWNSKKELREWFKKFFGLVLVLGLIWEMKEAVKSDSKVQELRKQNDDFEAGRYPRGSQLNWDIFAKRLKAGPKWKAEILYKAEDSESYEFAREFGIMMAEGGWKVVGFRTFSEGDISTNSPVHWMVPPVGQPSATNMPLTARIGVGPGAIGVIGNQRGFGAYNAFVDALVSAIINGGKNDSGIHTPISFIDDPSVPDGVIKIVVGQK